MYRKGTVLELQFSPGRLNDGAGDPFWIDLSAEEAARLLDLLQARLQPGRPDTEPPAVFALDGTMPAAAEASDGTDAPVSAGAADGFQQWICLICGWVYDEAAGLPEEGIAPGTRWADVPEDWRCPLCDVGKEDFAMVPF
ncbi:MULTISPECIES: rubredoxin [Cupriavidus]|uniref:rubredoxin n=1 Tax=Cupriavidus TaxID=106589 RepID=UPI0009F56B8C|nr:MULTISPECIES: rubredoxin [Cupriavidus]